MLEEWLGLPKISCAVQSLAVRAIPCFGQRSDPKLLFSLLPIRNRLNRVSSGYNDTGDQSERLIPEGLVDNGSDNDLFADDALDPAHHYLCSKQCHVERNCH